MDNVFDFYHKINTTYRGSLREILSVGQALEVRVWFGWFMVSNATLNNISAISWRSVLLVEETGVPGEKPPTCRKSLTNFIT
jgi:hypothetical protein